MEEDISEQGRPESLLRENGAPARAHVAELEAVMAVTPAVIWIAHDPECRRITGNAASDRLLRVTPGSNVSRTALPEEQPKHFTACRNGRTLSPEELPLQEAAATGRPVLDTEFDLVFDDG